MSNIVPGFVLNNGAEVLAVKGEKVLAKWDKAAGPEFVIWSVDSMGDAYGGRYFGDLIAAVDAFKEV